MKPTVYHNPRCSKSRETVKLLEENGIIFNTRLYLNDIPSKNELKKIIQALGFNSARELMRTKEAVYRSLELAKVDDEEQLLEAMVENPKLIERPIVIKDDKAKIGRPPESVLALFSL